MNAAKTVLFFYSEGLIMLKKALVLIAIMSLSLVGCVGQPDYRTAGEEISNYSSLSGKCIGWGFRRTENGPEFTQNQIKQMGEYNCIYKENTEEKVIYLTFDEGYENGYTSVLLDTLREKDVKATFFVTGPYVKGNPDLIKRMAKEGHIIGNHTVNHPSLPSVKDIDTLKNELHELDRLIWGICGKKTAFLRPPKGEYSEKTLAITRDMGYTNVFWSQAYVDWKDDVTKEEAFSKITKDLHPGCVLLLHAVSKGNSDALGDVIEYARKEGYVFKNLDEYIS